MITSRRRDGITLTEALLAMVIGFLILGIVFAIARMQRNIQSAVETHLTTSEALSQLDRRLVRDLDRLARVRGSDPITLAPSGDSLSFWMEAEEARVESGRVTSEQLRVIYTISGKDPLVLTRREGSREERLPMTGLARLAFELSSEKGAGTRDTLRVVGEIAAGRRSPARPVSFQYSLGEGSPLSSSWVSVVR